MVRKHSHPKYRIVEDHLRSGIQSGEFAIDTLLPTEEVLCTRYGVSRGTVRAALGQIEADGLIVRSPAIGSRVVSILGRPAFQAGWNSVEALLQYTKSSRLHVSSVEEIIFDKEMAEEFGFGPGRRVVRVEGIRCAEEETASPVCIVEIFFDALFNGIVGSIGETARPIADLIDDRYQVRIESIRQEIGAAQLSSDAATKLSAVAGGPSLVIKRWYFDGSGRMFQMTRSQYPAERFRYVVEFGRSNS